MPRKSSGLKISKFRAWRLDHGMTLEEESDLTGVSVPMLSMVERGEREFAPETKVKVARRLGVRIADLFDVEDLNGEAG